MTTYFFDAGAIVKRYLTEAGLQGLIFVTADNDLIRAAIAEKLPSENPNTHSQEARGS